MNLLIQYYKTDKDRDAEFLYCINRNLNLRYVDAIYIFCETNINIVNTKIHIIPNSNRMKYIDFISWSNINLPNQVCCIMNTDIYFDNTLKYLKDFDIKNKFIALTRYDVNGSNISFYSNNRSSDVWIYCTPIPEFGNFYLGIPHCDGRIIYEAYNKGLTIYNPSKLIYSYHLHKMGHRNWKWNFDYIYGEMIDTNWTKDLTPCELSFDFVDYPCNVELIKYLNQCNNKTYIEIGPSELGIMNFLAGANWIGDLYEPNERLYQQCKINYKNYNNIKIHNNAISNEEITTTFYNSNKNSSLNKNYLLDNNFGFYESIVQTKKISCYVDLICCDCFINIDYNELNCKILILTYYKELSNFNMEQINNLFIYRNKNIK